jgi:hypothetical protein
MIEVIDQSTEVDQKSAPSSLKKDGNPTETLGDFNPKARIEGISNALRMGSSSL